MLVIIFMHLYKLYWQFMMVVNYRQQCADTPNPKEWKWAKETTPSSFRLGSTLVLGGTVHPISSATSEINTFSHSSSNALQSMDDCVLCMIIVLIGGVGGTKGAVGWWAKALGWKEEIQGGKV
jgi:hypothetical protein